MTKPATDLYRRQSEEIIAGVFQRGPHVLITNELYQALPRGWPQDAKKLYWQVAAELLKQREM